MGAGVPERPRSSSPPTGLALPLIRGLPRGGEPKAPPSRGEEPTPCLETRRGGIFGGGVPNEPGKPSESLGRGGVKRGVELSSRRPDGLILTGGEDALEWPGVDMLSRSDRAQRRRWVLTAIGADGQVTVKRARFLGCAPFKLTIA